MWKSVWSVGLSGAFSIVLTVTPVPEGYKMVAVILAWSLFAVCGVGWLIAHRKSAIGPKGQYSSLQELQDSLAIPTSYYPGETLYDRIYYAFSEYAITKGITAMGALWSARAFELKSKDFYRLLDEIKEKQPQSFPFEAYEPEFPREKWYAAFQDARRRNKDLSDPAEAIKFFQSHTPHIAGSAERRALDEYKKAEAGKPSEAANQDEDAPKSLKELFETDFSLGAIKRDVPLNAKSGSPNGTVVVRLLLDYKAHAKFLSIYVPHNKLTADIIIALPQFCQPLVDDFSSKIEGTYRHAWEEKGVSSNDLKFTGRVYVYYEDPLDLEDLGLAEKMFKERNLTPSFRGHQYATTLWLARRAGDKPKQPSA